MQKDIKEETRHLNEMIAFPEQDVTVTSPDISRVNLATSNSQKL